MNGQGFDWSSLVAQTVHPTKVAILEAMTYVQEPLSPVLLARMSDEPLADVAYHTKQLRKLGVVELVSTRQRRGAIEHRYALVAS